MAADCLSPVKTPRPRRKLAPQDSDEKTSPPAKSEAPEASKKRQLDAKKEWFHSNMDLIAQADCIIGAQLADRKHFCEHTTPEMHKICDDVFNNVMKMGPHGAENNSVLLLGEADSGKTHVVEWCIKELRKAQPSTVVLRARGSAYATDVECLRHLATQMTDRLEYVPHATASFKAGMDWIKSVFRGTFKEATAMVMVLDQFEHFCSRARQTLLYNLFDIAQEAGVHLSVIGTSEKMDVMDSLEKRIRSRFSMRHLHTVLPTTMDGLVQVLAARMKLPADCGLKASFITQFNKNVEAALFAKRSEWKPHIGLGRPPSWFLARCVPVASLLYQACASESAASSSSAAEPPRKRVQIGSATNREATMLLLHSLTADDHIVLIALYRLNARGLPRTLSIVLHEIQQLHETPGQSRFALDDFNADLYSAAFDRLLRLRLLELARSGNADTAKRHLPIANSVDRIYGEFVRELSDSKTGKVQNPLRALPLPIQQWASRQRPAGIS